MAPKKTVATKRTPEGPKMPAAKKAKIDPMISGIVEALDLAESHLSADCRAMLVSMVPGAFGDFQEDRNEYQARAVAMIGEVVEGVQAQMHQAVETEDAKVLSIRESRASLEGEVEDASVAVAKAAAVCDAQNFALAEVSKAVLEKKSSLAVSVEAQKSGDAPFAPMQAERAQYEAVVAEDFQIVREGTSQTKKHSDKIIDLAKKIVGVDESLLQAMPSSCLKKADARSQFDSMVLDTLAKNFADHVASLTATLAGAKDGIAERAATVQTAQAAFEAVKAEQQAAATDMSAAQAAHREAQAAFAAAEAALTKFEPTLMAAEELAREQKATLDNYETWNVSCFQMMRDKKKKPQPVEVASATEVPQPIEPAAELAPVSEGAPVAEVAPAMLPVA